MAPKVSAQALADMRPGAAGAVLAAMDSEHVSSIISVMGADVLANAIGSMDAEDALRVIVGSSPSVRVTIVESLPVGAQGSILSMLPAEEAADLLRSDGFERRVGRRPRHERASSGHRFTRATRGTNVQLFTRASTEHRVANLGENVRDGARTQERVRTPLKILSETNPDKATSHLSGMLQRDAKSTAQVFSSFIVHSQGKVLSSFNAKDAGKMLQFLGPQNAAQALIEAVDGGTNAAVAAVALEALARLGVWPPSVDVPRFGVKVRGPLADVLLVMFELNPEHSALVLTALDPQVSASAIGAMSPATAGTLASAIPDPKIAALLLESMPHAKRAAMIIKMRPQPAADAASNMSVEHVVAIITTLYETQDPATMVIANDIISKMDSFKAGSVIVMLKEDFAVRILSALPPLVAADMISSGGLPSDKAGELLDRVKLDQAENVLSALPPSLAEEAVEKVSSTELKAKTASRTVVHLTSSLVSGPGCEECVAGLETKFIFESANPGGVRIHKGGASLHCDIYHLTFKAKDNSNEVEYIRGQAQEVNVQDMMNGSYEFTYKVDKAGEYDAVITSAGQTRTVRIKCKPAVLDPTQCAVAPLDENTRWRAGDVLVAKVLCRDRFETTSRRRRAETPPSISSSSPTERVRASSRLRSWTIHPASARSRNSAPPRAASTRSASSPPTSRDSGGAGCSASAFRARPSSSSSRRPPRTRLGRACNSAVYASEVEACCSDWPEDRWRSSSLRAIDSTTKPSLTKNGCASTPSASRIPSLLCRPRKRAKSCLRTRCNARGRIRCE